MSQTMHVPITFDGKQFLILRELEINTWTAKVCQQVPITETNVDIVFTIIDGREIGSQLLCFPLAYVKHTDGEIDKEATDIHADAHIINVVKQFQIDMALHQRNFIRNLGKSVWN